MKNIHYIEKHTGMLKKRIIILVGVFVIYFTVGTGICFGWGENWEEIRKAAGSIKSIQADFVQEKHMKMLVRPLISKGRLVYQAPNAMRWEYLSPIENVLLMDAGNVQRFVKIDGAWILDAGANLQGMQVVMEQITQWFAGQFADLPLFDAILEPASGGTGKKIVMTPKEAGVAKMIEKVVLSLSLTPGVMDTVTIYENKDSYTKINFVEPSVNQPVQEILLKEVQ